MKSYFYLKKSSGGFFKMAGLELKVGINIKSGPDQLVDDVLNKSKQYTHVCFVERHNNGKVKKQTTYIKNGENFQERIVLGRYENGSLASSLIYSDTGEEYVRWGWDKKGKIVVESYFSGPEHERQLVERLYIRNETGCITHQKVFVDGELAE